MYLDLAYYVMAAIFFVAFIVETLVTGRLFVHRQNINVSSFMRYWAIIGLGLVSVANLLGYMRLHINHGQGSIDPGNYVQAFFALASLNLFLWVWVFHLKLWGSKNGIS